MLGKIPEIVKPKEEEKEAKDENEKNKEEKKEEKPEKGFRKVMEIQILYDLQDQCKKALDDIPYPEFIDMTKEPLPPPKLEQIVKKPAIRQPKNQVTKFKILTPIPLTPEEIAEEEEKEKENQKEEDAKKDEEEEKKEGEESESKKDEEKKERFKKEERSRWIIYPDKKQKLFVKFFSENIGNFEDTLNFEIVGSNKHFPLKVTGEAEFPQLSDYFKSVFTFYKKTRPVEPPECYVSKQYIISENVFDFGSLLIGKDPEKRHTETIMRKVNSTNLRMSNKGKFPLHVDFAFRSSAEGSQSPFIIEPNSIDLGIGETKDDVILWAFPTEAKLIKDELICVIKDNPNPVVFNLMCTGAMPMVELEKEVIEFERLRLNQDATQVIKIKNTGSIPIKWNLEGLEEMPTEFLITTTSGIINPSKSIDIDVKFTSISQKTLEHDLTLQIQDNEGMGQSQEPKTIKLTAEAFEIDYEIVYEDEKNLVDFEDVRVGGARRKKFTLINKGLYSIKYVVNLKRRQTRELFSVEPMRGELESNDTIEIYMTFKSNRELKLKNDNQSSDVVIHIIEGKTDELYKQIPVGYVVNAVYSVYTITPFKNINFGPMQYGESKLKTFEIRNEGLFEFDYIIWDYNDEERRKSIKDQRAQEMEDMGKVEEIPVDPKDKKKGKEDKKIIKKEEKKAKVVKGGKKDAKALAEGSLKISQFILNPSNGGVRPGESAVIEATFEAEGAAFYNCDLAIDISCRNPADNPNGIPYSLAAESCMPGINTEDFQSIFEEQAVLTSLDPSVNTQSIITKSIYAIEENVFWFGTHIATKATTGITEKFKIFNTNKIPCTVTFSVEPRTNSKSEGFAFEVSPDSAKIQPHEYTYVKVIFSPTSMMTYGGIFEAVVENGDPKSKSGKLKFELRGEGVMPSLLLEKPKAINEKGIAVLEFKKTRLGKCSQETLVLKNEGQVPATVQFEQLSSEVFQLLAPLSSTILPKSYLSVEFKYNPKTANDDEYQASYSTMHNPFENQKLLLMGTGYEELLVFENLPEGYEEELKIGDCFIEKPVKFTFQISSRSTSTLKFEWINNFSELKFIPSIGHLKAGATKDITAIFKSNESKKIEAEPVLCQVTEIKQKGAFEDWDDTYTQTILVRPSELNFRKQKKEEEEQNKRDEAEVIIAGFKGESLKGKPGKKEAKKDMKKEIKKDLKQKKAKENKKEKTEEIVIDEKEEANIEFEETLKEPDSEEVGDKKKIGLKISAIVDAPSYECAENEIIFKPTLMFQSRSYKFTVKNTSLISLEFICKITNAENGVIDPGPYNIIPKKGSISAGCDETFIVNFSPMEAEDSFPRLLVFNIKNLNKDLKPLIIELNGTSERPVCHFELPPSKYKEKKEKDMAPIDQKYSIIEFESLGTKVRNVRKFMVINPTNQGYEFEWIEEEEKSKPNERAMFRCLTKKGTILGGKKFEMMFEYTPDTVGKHESFWQFKINSEKIIQFFIVVGMVVEPIVLFETTKINFGPLLIGGKNREVVKLINQEHLPFPFNFDRQSIKGSQDDGDSLSVKPISGVVNPQSHVEVEIIFRPKFEKSYNYNLVCNVKHKARPLNINVKGVGYKLLHEVKVDNLNAPLLSKEPFPFNF